jgi:hypothetical protein
MRPPPTIAVTNRPMPSRSAVIRHRSNRALAEPIIHDENEIVTLLNRLTELDGERFTVSIVGSVTL